MRIFLRKKFKFSFFKKRRIKKQIARVVYRYLLVKTRLTYNFVNKDFYTTNFHVTLPKRQQHFVIQSFITKKPEIFSCGKFLNTFGKRSKYFKRDPRNVAALTLQLKSTHAEVLSKLYLFTLRNFNKRQYEFFFKFIDMLKPSVCYFLHKQSYIPRFLPRRRIKRVILRKLQKQ